MISRHCGERLRYVNGRFKNPALTYHRWQCPKCGREFEQKIRLPKV